MPFSPGATADNLAYALNAPLAMTTVVMTVRVPDTPEVTMAPLNVSLPLVAAAAGTAVAVAAASAIPPAGAVRRYGGRCSRWRAARWARLSWR